MAKMKVWIDRDLCTGDAICADEVPDVFEMDDEGLAFVKPGMEMLTDENLIAEAKRMSEECPGACIFVEEVKE
jgi:ferredoxin